MKVRMSTRTGWGAKEVKVKEFDVEKAEDIVAIVNRTMKKGFITIAIHIWSK